MSHGEFVVNYEKKALPSKIKNIGLLLLAIGLVGSIYSMTADPQRFAFASLLSFMFLLSLGMGSLFFIALEHIAGVVWSVPFRRVAELLSNMIWVAPIFALPAVVNIMTHSFDMYHWTHLEEVMKDPILAGKRSYLNESFFLLRSGVIVAVMLFFRTFFVKGSLKQDTTKDQKISKRNVIMSAIFMLLFAVSITIMAMDYMMSLEPHWFSTIFGVYYFAGTFWVTIAVLTILSVKLNENGYLIKGISKDHYYSLGAFMFAFTAFWAYIAFSQFMLIWYANIPEETFWFMPRMEGGWMLVSIALIFAHFIIPFGLLINRASKMNPNRLVFAAWWIIFTHILDMYWIIYPTYSKIVSGDPDNYAAPVFGLEEISVLVLAFGALITVFTLAAKSTNLVAIGDPKLQRGLEFHL